MSDIQVVTKIEVLPNEIFLKCFEYFDAANLFYSFDQLNYRFSRLIRTTKMHFNYQVNRKSIVDQFCKEMLFTPELKTQIRSIDISNNGACFSIEMFLLLFPLNQFPQLQSLTLTKVRENNVEQLKPMLSVLSELICFRLINSLSKTDELLSLVPLSKLRILSLQVLDPILASSETFWSMKNLTVSICSMNQFDQLFQRAPMLQVLVVQKSRHGYYWRNKDNNCFDKYTSCLQQLTIHSFSGQFDDLINVLKQTPNLRSLRVSAEENREIISAYRWEDLITSSLPRLTSFNFRFTSIYNGDIYEKCERFQSDFWQKKHQWYIECGSYDHSVHIYTIPYMFSTYVLTPHTERYFNQPMNNENAFKNVSDLTLHMGAITCQSSYYFPNVTSLTLDSMVHYEDIGDPFLRMERVPFLKKIVPLSNLKHLTISTFCKINSSSVFLRLLKETPQLSSLAMELNRLQSFFNDDELYQQLNRMITKLHLINHLNSWFSHRNELERFCKVFSNLEQLICLFNNDTDLFFLFKHLPKLSMMKIDLPASVDQKAFIHSVENEAQKLKLTIHIELDNDSSKNPYIWINRQHITDPNSNAGF